MSEPHVLAVEVDTSTPNHPTVRLMVDGRESLASVGTDEPNSPQDILLSGALLPTDPPRRIAFYGCGCGTFGCANVAGLVTRVGDRVTWSDFRSLTGAYTSALPDEEDVPDPYTSGSEDDGFHDRSEIDLPDLSFDADQYLAVVESATADRSWVTRTQLVARELRVLLPVSSIYPNPRGESVQISVRTGRKGQYLDSLDVPPGDPEDVARSLVALLDAGVSLRRIKRKRLWS